MTRRIKLIKKLSIFLRDWWCLAHHTSGYSIPTAWICEDCGRIWQKDRCISRSAKINPEELAELDVDLSAEQVF